MLSIINYLSRTPVDLRLTMTKTGNFCLIIFHTIALGLYALNRNSARIKYLDSKHCYHIVQLLTDMSL